jgi:hypothetical protein
MAIGGDEAAKRWRYATSKKLWKSAKNLASSPLLKVPVAPVSQTLRV